MGTKQHHKHRATESGVHLSAAVGRSTRHHRRGSFLIMVVGTLALLAVISVVYVLIGRADSQTSASTLKQSVRKEVPEQMKDYILGILSDDIFDTVYAGERGKTGAQRKYRRETWDYPSTAYKVHLPAGPRDVYEDVTVGGTNTKAQFTPTGNLTGTDPWLASNEPTLLDFDNSNNPAANEYWFKRLDWAQISDVAPDGAFVNLFNLRGPTKNGKNKPNFHATPWEMRGGNDPNNPNSVQAQLTLNANAQLDYKRDSTLDFGGNAKPMYQNDARPADYASRQRAAFFPKADPSFGPDDPRYILYQWADADGDGILDSRWFEMTEARVQSGPFKELISHDDGFRYFFAVRIVDLSGKVNVNTATDVVANPNDRPPAPTFADPYGLYPSTVDLRRLLTLEDVYNDMNNVDTTNNTPIGYNAYPKGANQADYSGYTKNTGFEVGQRAYDALRMTLDTGTLPGPGYNGLVALDSISGGNGNVDREFSSEWFTSLRKDSNGLPSPLLPSEYYEQYAGFGNDGGTTVTTGSTIGRAFGLDSLFELLTFNGINDSEHRSPLESVLGGRSSPTNFSPLRDNRPTSLERDTHITRTGKNLVFNNAAKAWAYTDIRRDLTTISGARPIKSRLLDDDTPTALSADDVRMDVRNVMDNSATPVQDLFEVYADALLPYSYIPLHWRPSVHPAPTDTLYYGNRGPELALRTAAHAAVNFVDAYDLSNNQTTEGPTIRTVLIDGSASFRSTNIDNGRDPKYPWKLLDLDASLSGPGDSRLWDGTPAAGEPTAHAVNIFGVEAQPFIVEAASFIMYTDTPATAGNPGDQDFPLGGNNITFRPTINGDPDANNPDCLFEVLAFQIHNPFDQTITLKSASASNTDPGQYYIEYGGHYYKIAQVDFASYTEQSTPITIDPQESRTFYILSGDIPDIVARINNALDSTGSITDADFQLWLDAQLGDSTTSMRLAEFDPQSGALLSPGASFVKLQSPTPEENAVVKLWRIEKPALDTNNGGFSINGITEDASTNDISNDTLVDRMRDPDPANPTLNRELEATPDQTGAITGAQIGGEPGMGDPPLSPDNEGLTLTRWGSLARREDPNAANVPLGGLPAYCIEAKTQSNTESQNTIGNDGSSTTLDIGDFVPDAGDLHLLDVLNNQGIGGTPVQLIDTINMDPQDKSTGHEIGANMDGVPFVGDADHSPLYVMPHINNQEFKVDVGNGNAVSVLRLADMLLPLGIGPYQVPELPDEDQQWTTLSEALAFALRYEEDDASVGAYANAFVDDVNNNVTHPAPLLTTGHLQYDQFVPFYDTSADGVFDRTNDTRWGLGVPMAASLLDAFRTLPDQYGSLYRMTPGLVNVNTATRQVARTLPLLSPPENLDPTGNPLWWWIGGMHNSQSDIASTLIAYRDRIALHVRDLNGNTSNEPLDFRDINDGTFINDAPGVDRSDNGRAFATGVDAIHEEPGIRSLGELAVLRDLDYAGSGNLNYSAPNDIDRLGFDGKNLDEEGVYSYGVDSDGDGQPDVEDGVIDDFAEKLAITNAVAGSVSTRSDVFAVWFVVHGYQESDVKNLGPNDPMVPTIARRFVMVVDRSNVLKPGDKPKVLLFKEVPM